MYELSVNNNGNGNYTIVVSGEIDICSAPDFKEKLYSAIGDIPADVVLDFTNLEYIDSMGLGILVGALKRIKGHGHDIVIKNAGSTVKKLFRITGLDKVFVMEESQS